MLLLVCDCKHSTVLRSHTERSNTSYLYNRMTGNQNYVTAEEQQTHDPTQILHGSVAPSHICQQKLPQFQATQSRGFRHHTSSECCVRSTNAKHNIQGQGPWKQTRANFCGPSVHAPASVSLKSPEVMCRNTDKETKHFATLLSSVT